MKIRIRKRIRLDDIVLTLSLLNVLIFSWLGISSIINALIFILVLCSMTMNVMNYWEKSSLLLFFIACIIYPIINCRLLGGSYSLIFSNMKGIIMRLFFLIYMCYLMIYKAQYLENFLKNISVLLNGYVLCNIPIIILQCSGFYSLVALIPGENTYAPDLISGLFGENGTAYMAIFFSMFIVYNCQYCSVAEFSSIKRKIFKVYNIILIISFSLLSYFINDNKGFFIVAPCFYGAFILIKQQGKNKRIDILKRAGKYIKNVIWIFVIGIFVWFIFSKTNIRLVKSLNNILQNAKDDKIHFGSSERFRMIYYVLQDFSHMWIGYGIGRYKWLQDGVFGFYHFGQSNMGSFLMLGGIAFVVLLFSFLFVQLNKVFKNHIVSILLVLCFLILSLYNKPFTVSSPFISAVFFMVVCWWCYIENSK